MTTNVNEAISFKQPKTPLRQSMYECAMKYTQFIQGTNKVQCVPKLNLNAIYIEEIGIVI